MTEPNLTGDSRTVTVRIPISIRRRGGRKLVVAPDGTTDTWAVPCRRIDNAMVKAIARAFRWREMLENGKYATIAEIAAAEKINKSYVGRSPAADTAGTGHRRGDPEWAAAGGDDAGGAGAAVFGAVGSAKVCLFVLRLGLPPREYRPRDHPVDALGAVYHLCHVVMRPWTAGCIKAAGGPRN